jgi:acetyltransferase
MGRACPQFHGGSGGAKPRAMTEDLAMTAALRDGTAIELRPIRPDDQPLIEDIASHMNTEDLRRRFFMPVQELSHQLAAQLSQIDHDRAMAVVARTGDGATGLGAARFVAEADDGRAEFALGVRSDWHGRGLGRLLMERLIAGARQRGLAELYGDVLRENEPMIRLARGLGFAVAPHPSDATLLRVVKPLERNAQAAS